MALKKELPPMVRYPNATWRAHVMPEDWKASLDAWISLAEVHLSLSSPDFEQLSAKGGSVVEFLLSYVSQAATSHDQYIADPVRSKALRRDCFLLTKRMLDIKPPPERLLSWTFLADFGRAYGKTRAAKVLGTLWKPFPPKALELSLASLKTSLTTRLESGFKESAVELEQTLKRLNHLLHASPDTAVFFTSGTDFLDALIQRYKFMNPPLRKAIVSAAYLCLAGLTEGSRPNFSLLADQLYALKAVAEAHKSGPTSENDSLVAELVTATPILKQTERRIQASGASLGRVKAVLVALGGFRKAGGGRPKILGRRRGGKGKERAVISDEYGHGVMSQLDVHRMSLISQVQDLFSDLGSGFVLKLLDEYNDDVEQVIGHLLENSLPSHLHSADREEAFHTNQVSGDFPADSTPLSTLPALPTRRNVFDGDELDQLTIDASRLYFGRKNPEKTADDVLRDESSAPSKVSILSALAVFDSDDDERDDTYDVEDVGGSVDSATPGNNPVEANADTESMHDEALFRAFKMTPGVFDRDAATRRGKLRTELRDETKMTDEAIEGWALMLSRDPRRLRRLEAKYLTFSGGQRELAPTSWRGDNGGSATEDSDGPRRERGGFRGRGGGGRGGGGQVAGPSGEKNTEIARRRKEANKGSRANHNRKDAAARKMARGGFAG